MKLKISMLPHRKHFSITITGEKVRVMKIVKLLEQNKHELHIDLADNGQINNSYFSEFVIHRTDIRKAKDWLSNNLISVKSINNNGSISKEELWTVSEIISEINKDRFDTWTDYDINDWAEGWQEWVFNDCYIINESTLDRQLKYQAINQA
jgi:hypothetical protein